MAKLPGKYIQEKDEISQELDFKKHFGVDLSNEPRLREEIGREMVRIIEKRTTVENRDVRGNKLPGYSKEYVESEDFAFYGKTPGDVDMQLTGDMMASVDFEDTREKVKISVGEGETGKAHGHITGFRDHPTIKKGKKRDFFGITSKEINEIKSSFSSDFEQVKEAQKSSVDLQQITSVATTLGSLFEGEDGINRLVENLFRGQG